MSDYISLSFEFIDKYVRFTDSEYLRMYLYILRTARDGDVPNTSEIAKALDMTPAKVEFILEYWASRGELIYENGKYRVGGGEGSISKSGAVQRIKSTKPSYSQAEIDAVISRNRHISGMMYQAETILNKVLTASDIEMLFSFNDWLGLPVEVIMMLLSYAAKKGKTTKRYLETVAIDWAEKGIDTFEAAESYISELEEIDSAERKVRSILGIYDRGLTATEKKYITQWSESKSFSEELIALAYDKTVEYTGKLSWAYMDKLLKSWNEKGCKTKEDVAALDEEFYKNVGKRDFKNGAKPSKLNNYEDGNKTDYAALEEQILDMMLDNDKA